MNRKKFIQTLALLPLAASAMKLKDLTSLTSGFENTEEMPVLFVGHGSPMNAIEDNIFSREMKAVGQRLVKPKAILMVSAHWETKGTFVTAQDMPPTIHDFGGFPQALFDVQYPAPGSKWLAGETQNAITSTNVLTHDQWGFDHGCWSVARNMYPDADIPMIQLSLDYSQGAQYHFDLAQQLSSLRKKGVLIIGSGNMVHNFSYAQFKGRDFNEPYGLDWALAANDQFKKLIVENNTKPLINYSSMGREAQLAIPTPEHYLPLLYALALRGEKDNVSFFNDVTVGASFSMTSVLIDK